MAIYAVLTIALMYTFVLTVARRSWSLSEKIIYEE